MTTASNGTFTREQEEEARARKRGDKEGGKVTDTRTGRES